eukprot:Seg1590.1 transcript_id=Seg1590.1/GoldUCD/mRNA.D3Y31 product="hypothetical protein" protein_id=Seg1590.1/GoldUCD/D3Y31
MANNEGEQQGSFRRCCHLEYFRTLLGIFKLVEFLVVVLGLIFMSSVSTINVSSIEFYIFVAATTLIFVTIHVVLNVLGIYHRMPLIIIAHITHFILCTIAALAFLISSSITFSKFTDWRVHVGSVFGLIAMGLFILEAVHNFIQHKRGANEQQATKSKDPEAPKPIEGQPPSY